MISHRTGRRDTQCKLKNYDFQNQQSIEFIGKNGENYKFVNFSKGKYY